MELYSFRLLYLGDIKFGTKELFRQLKMFQNQYTLQNIEILDNYFEPSMKNEIKATYQESENNDVILREAIRKLDNLIGEKSTKAEKLLVEKTKGILKKHDNAIKIELLWDEIINSPEYSQPECLTVKLMAIANQQEIASTCNEKTELAYRDLMESKNVEDLQNVRSWL